MRAASGHPLLGATALLSFLPACAPILFQRDVPDRIPLYARSADGEGTLRAGAAEVDITPPGPVYLGGYGMNRTSTGVHLPLKARALVLERGGLKVALVGVDNLGLHRDDVEWIKLSIDGFALGNVVICASHTHAGPDLLGLWGFYFLSSGRDEDVLRQVQRGIRQAVLEAERRLAPCRLRLGRTLLPEDGVAKNTNRPGLFDRDLTVLIAERVADGSRAATLVHFACHPEVLRRGNELISSDLVGDLCARIAARTGTPAVFLNGALGAMVTPAGKPTGPAGFAVMGPRLEGLVAEAEAAATELAPTPFSVRRTDLYLPLTAPGYRLGLLLGILPRPLHQGHVRTTVGVLEIGTLRAAMVPGEMEPALAGRVSASLGGSPSLVLGLADDELGYLMAREDAELPTFRYESTLTPCPDAGDRVQKAIADLARTLIRSSPPVPAR